MARAPFRSAMVRVKREMLGRVLLGRELRAQEPSLIAHLAKRVLSEGQWVDTTTPEQYLRDLCSVVNNADVRMVVYTRRGKGLYLGLLAPNTVPAERLGPKPEANLWVVYSADYGTILSGYQVSSIEQIALPEGVRWL